MSDLFLIPTQSEFIDQNTIRINLLDEKQPYGVQYGLNWAFDPETGKLRIEKGKTESARSGNESYFQLPKAIYQSDFFPAEDTFHVIDDLGNDFVFSRSQPKVKDGKPQALSTPESNKILGLYIRHRLGVKSGSLIRKEHLIKYGRTDIVFTKTINGFLMDFSKVAENIRTLEIPIEMDDSLSESGLAKILANDKKSNGTYAIHLFGIQYAKLIQDKNFDKKEIIRLSEIGDNYLYELSKGIGIYNLAIDNGFLKITQLEKFHSSNELSKLEDFSPIPFPHNRIIFGAPGTGKSYLLNENAEKYFTNENIERVTFHPNYSYSQFVGTYKPVQDFVDEKQITYQYVPGPFMRIYAAAKQNPSQNFLLIIEEINRANVAAVFGDIFQLLDRKSNDESEYHVAASEDIKKYLAKNGIYEDELSIPSNMYIWATMNSADQGVFPMDTAFKRRWEFEYIGIDDNEGNVQEYEIPINANKKVNWNELRKVINDKLIELSVNEDKLLGPFFLSKNILENALNDTESFIKLFKSKVIMYLFEDAAKLKAKQLFKIDSNKYIFSEICKQFDEKGLDIFEIDPSIVKISDITGKNIDNSKNNSSDFSLLQ